MSALTIDYTEAAYAMAFGYDVGNTYIAVEAAMAAGVNRTDANDAYVAWLDLAYQAQNEDIRAADLVDNWDEVLACEVRNGWRWRIANVLHDIDRYFERQSLRVIGNDGRDYGFGD